MKFETLKTNRNKRIMGGLIVFVILAIVIVVPGSRAKYQVTGSIDVVDGTITYTSYDIEVIELYVDDILVDSLDDSSYYSIDTINSYCTVNNEVDDNITFSYDTSTKELAISNITNIKTNCYLYFNTIEIDPPTTTITVSSSTTGNNSWYKALSLLITGSSTDSTVESLSYCTSASTSCEPSTEVESSSTTVALSSNASAQYLCANSTDAYGNTSDTVCSNRYYVDKTIPTISDVSTEVTSDSITVTVTASDSHSGIATYYYSSDGGSTYKSSSNNYYTFSSLTIGTTYSIKVYVVDNAGNSSSIKTTTATPKECKSSSTIIASKTISARSDFSSTLTSDTTGVVYSASDGMYGGTTYYWAGAATDNYAYFAGYYWRIVRVNGDSSIRLIYQGTDANATGDDATIGTSTYNSAYSRASHVGFTYSINSQRPSSQNGGSSSTIKGVLDTWYSTYLSSYSSYLDTSGMFCNDRTSYTDTAGTTTGWAETGTTLYYGAYIRLYANKSPSFGCSATNDIYTTSIGLITADEAAFAGAVEPLGNFSYYLYTGSTYWTMSPFDFTSGQARVFTQYYTGSLIVFNVISSYGVRPVINLSSSVTLSGSGTSSDPYEVC